MITGDELYCCLGTTIKKAGSKENFRKVDYDMPLQMAKAAFKNGIKSYLLVSSVGANAESSNFYLRTKGEVEHAVKEVGFEKLIILQPSFLLGKRNEFRLGEKIGKIIFRFFELFLFGKLKKYQAVQAENVAKTMIYLANAKYEKTVYQSDEINFICERVIKS